MGKGHKILPNASLIPENDPTALFISAGMHPLVPYLLGEPHPQGKRLVSNQRCLRTGDIDEVGDSVHHTFFEMLGNWSLGDYWKEETINWSYEFLTSKDWLGISKEKIAVSVFAGDSDAHFDQESYQCWLSLGIAKERIAKLPKENNWWGPAGQTGPCGPDTEMFVWVGRGKAPVAFDPEDTNWVEVWNDVFMEYEKRVKERENGRVKKEYEFVPLKQRNVDTGMGVERTLAVLNGLDDDYQTELFLPIIQELEKLSGKRYQENVKEFRIIADHLKAAVFLVADGLTPSNKQRGYVLRRLIRRSVVKMMQLGVVPPKAVPGICQRTIEIYGGGYFTKPSYVLHLIIGEEVDNFLNTLHKSTQILQTQPITGRLLFDLHQSQGLPIELSLELLEQWGRLENREKLEGEFKKEFKKHQELSRTASVGMFKGGLADSSEIVTKYHTATHLLQAALREVLGEHVGQKGSNITAERLRFDFSHPEKLSAEQIRQIENLVNEKIKENLPVKMEMMNLDEAKAKGAMAVFTTKYGEKVKVYSIGSFSKEVCGGPHTDFTGKLGKFKIIKEEAAGVCVRRIYAVLENTTDNKQHTT